MRQNGRCLVYSMNLLNWGMYGAVSPTKVRLVCDLLGESRPELLCLSEVGPNDAVEQLTRPLAERGLRYEAISVGTPNSRGIRNVMLGREGLEVLDGHLKVPPELVIPALAHPNFQMGGLKLRLSREPLAVLIRTHGLVLAVAFFHPKSKCLEDYQTGQAPERVPDQTYAGLCKMVASIQNFGQCMLAREWVDRCWSYNELRPEWGVRPEEVRFVILGDWNANPQEEQRRALEGYVDAGLPEETRMFDGIARSSTDMEKICTIRWAGDPSSFDAILVDHVLNARAQMRVIPVELVDFFGVTNEERSRLENEVLDHCPVGLFLKEGT